MEMLMLKKLRNTLLAGIIVCWRVNTVYFTENGLQ
jgi:hypothetical protein